MSTLEKLCPRVIRVFVSSTFRDMQEERDELVLRVFPQLRELCDSRGVTWSEVELRWGITEEQAERSEVLPIVLSEVKRCRPYFIGLLGDRYGWIPGEIPRSAIDQEPWLGAYSNDRRSITEFEILQGVLNDPNMAEFAFFYFRDPSYTDSVPPQLQREFIEEDPVKRKLLQQLKARIRSEYAAGNLHYAPRENFHNAQDLGRLILEDFTSLIETAFPGDEQTSPLEQVRAVQESIARTRSTFYVSRDDEISRLKQHFVSDEPPLVVHGAVGGGMSHLLAYWVVAVRESHPDCTVFFHSVRATADSSSVPGLLRRMMTEWNDAQGVDGEITASPEEIRSRFSDWLRSSSGHRRVLLVLDGLDQLEDVDDAQLLDWLPKRFPDYCRVVVSISPGAGLDELRHRDWPELEVKPLQRSDRENIVSNFLKVHRRELSAGRIERIIDVELSCTPLFLITLLDELRQFGEHERLDECIDNYVSATSLTDMFDRIIDRWEDAYGREVVGKTLTCIWAARSGLSESEVLGLLGEQPPEGLFDAYAGGRSRSELNDILEKVRQPRRPFPRAEWTPFFLACKSNFLMNMGRILFSNSHLRKAVESRYLETEKSKHDAHMRLAVYFEAASLPATTGYEGTLHFSSSSTVTHRVFDEVPWQLQAAGRWADLAHHLSCLPVFGLACELEREFEWMQYWKAIELAASRGETPAVDVPGMYVSSLKQLSANEMAMHVGRVSQFLRDLGHPDATSQLLDVEEAVLNDHGLIDDDRFLKAGILNDRGLIARDSGGQQAEALGLFTEAADLLHSGGKLTNDEKRLLASVLMNQTDAARGTIPYDACRSQLQRARTLMAETTGETSPETATIIQSLGNLALTEGRIDEAFSYHCQAHALRRQSLGSEHRDVAISLYNIGATLIELDRLFHASLMWQRAEEIFRRQLANNHSYLRMVRESLQSLEAAVKNAHANRSGFAVILFVFHSLPTHDQDLGPTSRARASRLAQLIADALTDIWDDGVAYASDTPVLILSAPGFHEATSLAVEQPIAKRFANGLLRVIELPDLTGQDLAMDTMIKLTLCRKAFVEWAAEQKPEVLMVKPITLIGATVNRTFISAVRKGFRSGLWKQKRSMIVETVPFDGVEGPVLAVVNIDKKRKPYIMPSEKWRQRAYQPTSQDDRATGVFYLNVARLRPLLRPEPATRLCALDHWSMEPLQQFAYGPISEQLKSFEDALAQLSLNAQPASIEVPANRAANRFTRNEVIRNAEELLRSVVNEHTVEDPVSTAYNLALECERNPKTIDKNIAQLSSMFQASPELADAVLERVSAAMKGEGQLPSLVSKDSLDRMARLVLMIRGPSQAEIAQAPKDLRCEFPTPLPLTQNIVCPACGLPYSLSLSQQLEEWRQHNLHLTEIPIRCNNAGCGALTMWVIPCSS